MFTNPKKSILRLLSDKNPLIFTTVYKMFFRLILTTLYLLNNVFSV